MKRPGRTLVVGLLALAGIASSGRGVEAPDPADTDKANALFAEALSLFRDGEYGRAIEALDRAIALSPDRADFHVRRGECHLSGLDYVRAASDFSAALRLAPQSYDGLVDRAIVRLAADPKSPTAREQARSDLTEALKLAPDRGEAHLVRYHLLMWGRSAKPAETELERALAADRSLAPYRPAYTLPFVPLRRNAGEEERLARLARNGGDAAADRRAQALQEERRAIRARQDAASAALAEQERLNRAREAAARKIAEEDLRLKRYKVILFTGDRVRQKETGYRTITHYVDAQSEAQARSLAVEANKGFKVLTSARYDGAAPKPSVPPAPGQVP